MKPQLKFSLLALFVFILIVWFLVSEKTSKLTLEDNLSEQNASLQSFNQEQSPQTKQIKGLFADYKLDDFNKSEFNASLKAEAKLAFDASKMTLLAYTDIFMPVPSYYFDFFNKNDKNASSKGTLTNKAKLCIIIDDMATKEQVNALKATGLKLTPSFFPADSSHPKTPILAREFEFFMVHLPLAALHYHYEERQTLEPSDTQEFINAKIAQIVRDFHGVKFINNHTGSLFTDDTQAMRKLFRALKAHGLVFVDSMTINSSKGALVSKEFGQIPIKRDIFLDNSSDLNDIKVKIVEAVNLAHKKGFAIAIAHPRKNTFKALKQSKDVLKSVELVYVNELYENP